MTRQRRRQLRWQRWRSALIGYGLVVCFVLLLLVLPVAKVLAKASVNKEPVLTTIPTQHARSSQPWQHQRSLLPTASDPSAIPVLTQAPGTVPTSPAPQPEKRVSIVEVVIRSPEGDLPKELKEIAYQVIKIRPGGTTTQADLQKDVDAIFATGFFSEVRVTPEDTPLGVRVTFDVKVKPNPILRRVQVEGRQVLPDRIITEIFSPQYGKTLNLRDLQEGIKKINQWYQDQGYVLAQVIDTPQVSDNGVVTLTVAEGVVEDIQVRFLTKDGEATDEKGWPIRGRTKDRLITQEVSLKPGDVFLRSQAEADLKRVSDLGVFADVRLSLNPGQDLRKVVIVLNVIESGVLEDTELQRTAKSALDAEGKGDKLTAINLYEKVLNLARLSKSRLDEALTLNNIANFYKDSRDYRQARDYYTKALVIFQESQSPFLEAITLINLGEIYSQLGEADQAFSAYSKALQRVQDINTASDPQAAFGRFSQNFDLDNKEQMLKSLLGMGGSGILLDMTTMSATIGDQQQARYLLKNQAYPRLSTLSRLASEGTSKIIGTSKQQSYREFYERYKSEIEQTWLQLPEIITLLVHYPIYASLEEPAKGKVYTEAAQQKTLDLIKTWQRAIQANQTGQFHAYDGYIKAVLEICDWWLSDRNDPKQAPLLGHKISELFQELMNNPDIPKVNLQAGAASSLGQEITIKKELDPQTLIPYIQMAGSLILAAATSDDDQQSLRNLGQILSILEEVLKTDVIDQSASLSTLLTDINTGIRFYISKEQGNAYFRLTQYQAASVAYQESLRLLQTLSVPNQTQSSSPEATITDVFYQILAAQQPSILLALGKVYEELDDLQDAYNAYQEALKLFETPVKFGEQSFPRGNSLNEAEAHYGLAKIAWQLGDLATAQQQIEAALTKSEVPPMDLKGKSLGSGFSSAELKYRYRLRGNVFSAGLTLSSSKLKSFTINGKTDPTNPCNNQAAYFACKQKYFGLQIDLLSQGRTPNQNKVLVFEASERSRLITNKVFRADDPEKATLGRTRPAKLAEIQALLDKNTLLLEYWLGEQQSYLWAVSQNDLQTYSLPGQSTLEAKAKEFYDLLTTPTGRVRPQTTAQVGKELSQLLLGPVAQQLGQKRLLIVADGVLQYLPFGVLPDLAAKPALNRNGLLGEFAPYLQPLLVNHEIVNLLSGSAMVDLRQNHSRRPSPSQELAVFADPVFNFEDERAKSLEPAPDPALQDASPLLQKVEAIYPRLPGTEQEAKQIAQFVPSSKVKLFSGFAANYETAISPELGKYRLVHFATHGFFNPKAPERSGVVLSALKDNGDIQRGSITPAAALGMTLSAADLVVLSGCRTGLGVNPIREGLTGLVGALMSAGTERVVASLWSVDDEATKELMTRFYRNMLEKKLPISQALRAAQLSMWQEARWQTPYNWAAFVPYGEWQ